MLTTQPVIEIRDAEGNLVDDDTTVVSVAIKTGAGTLDGTLTATATNGVATFAGVTLTDTVGENNVLTFTSVPVLTSADSGNVTVTAAGAAAQLAITQQPVGGQNGAALTTQPVIQIQDATGNLVDDDTTVVTLAIKTGAGGTLGGTLTATAINGVATFAGVTLTGTVGENYVLTFTSVPVLTAADSGNVTVTAAGAAAQLAITQQPVGGANGAVLTTQPVIEIRDAEGNLVDDDTTVVTVAIKTGAGGTLDGTLTATATNGVATFAGVTLTDTVGANYVLTFTSVPVLTSADSGNVTVTAAGAAAQLAITQQPVGGANGAVLTTQPVIEIQDAEGNLVDDDTTVVSVAIKTGAGTLDGTLTATATNGVATFAGVTLTDTVGENNVLTFTSVPVLTSADSGNVTVTAAGAAAQLAITQQPVGGRVARC